MTTDRARLRQPFLFVGNHPCLDFINTQMIVRGNSTDLLGGCEDLVSWLVQASMVDKVQSAVVMTLWNHKDREQLFEQGIIFRGTLREMAARIIARKSIPDSAVASINQILSRCPGYSQLVYKKGGFERQFQSQAKQKDGLLAPLAEAASHLLCSSTLSLVKKCGNPSCILYFYDTTKNHTRNWCSMQLCGNRIKVAAHYLRKRSHPTH
ncbi:MAG: ABATE domain-containing protein [Nitrospiraceae bacterium]